MKICLVVATRVAKHHLARTLQNSALIIAILAFKTSVHINLSVV